MSDCGLFAIAFAMAICGGQRPEELMFDAKIMRQHLLQCLENRVITQFPAKKRKCQRKMKGRETVRVYCRCRLQEGGSMILCDLCGEWYHDTCVNVPSEVWATSDSNWQCCNCS